MRWLALRRALGPGRCRQLAGAAALFLLASLAPGGEGTGGTALRAGAALAGLGLVVAAAPGARRSPGPFPLSVEGSHPLGRDVGVALIQVSGRRWLVGWGPNGVSLLAEPGQEAREP